MKSRIIIIASLLFFSCLPSGRFYRVLDRPDVETSSKGGIIRTIYCDLYIENVRRELWPVLKKSQVYKARGSDAPDGVAFLFIVDNTWDRTISIDRVYILDKDSGKIYSEEDFKYTPADYIDKRFCVNPEMMRQSRRLLTDAKSIEDINYDELTVEYKFDFIAPGDKVFFFKFFTFVPQKKNIKICVVFKYNDLKKIIDFDIGLSDYLEKQ